ncbi:MAG: D-sedoheptulose 7-phosphate isomerase [Desulfovibrio sp.]|nr:D-sedoheptulose 7-phosphate isomerase [Desulfovibrio sp.]
MNDNSMEIIDRHAQEGSRLREFFFREQAQAIGQAALRMALCLASGGKILLCGNGGSAADAQHLAAEFVNRFLIDRPAQAAIALNANTSNLTAIGNDLAFNRIFSRQVEALGRKGDILLGISTSGNSANVLAAMQTALQKEMFTIGLTGQGGGDMRSFCRMLLAVPSDKTPLIQEIHITVGHLLCQLADYYLFENAELLEPYLQKNIESKDCDDHAYF